MLRPTIVSGLVISWGIVTLAVAMALPPVSRVAGVWHCGETGALESGGVGATADLGEGPVVDEVSVLPDRHHRVVIAQRLNYIDQGLGFGRHRHGLEGAELDFLGDRSVNRTGESDAPE
jgi:hypothetical protein